MSSDVTSLSGRTVFDVPLLMRDQHEAYIDAKGRGRKGSTLALAHDHDRQRYSRLLPTCTFFCVQIKAAMMESTATTAAWTCTTFGSHQTAVSLALSTLSRSTSLNRSKDVLKVEDYAPTASLLSPNRPVKGHDASSGDRFSKKSSCGEENSAMDEDEENPPPPTRPNNSPSVPAPSSLPERKVLADITNSVISPPNLSLNLPLASPSHHLETPTHLRSSVSNRKSRSTSKSPLHKALLSFRQAKRKSATIRRGRRNAISLSPQQANLIAEELAGGTQEGVVEVKAENVEVKFNVTALDRNLFLVSRRDGHRLTCSKGSVVEGCACVHS